MSTEFYDEKGSINEGRHRDYLFSHYDVGGYKATRAGWRLGLAILAILGGRGVSF